MNKKNVTLWLTGLPCSGKTTIALRLEEAFNSEGYHVAHLDGDDVRGKINSDLGFSHEDRRENLRRVAHIANLFNEKGNLVIASFVSPTNEFRELIKGIIDNIWIVYVKCSVEECERRDVKGMYKKARLGEIQEFTGVSAPFEEPINPTITVDTENNDVDVCVKQILERFEL